MKTKNLERKIELAFTPATGILGGIGGVVYTTIEASADSTQDMRYVLGGLALGSLIGLALDIYCNYKFKRK